MISIGVNCSGFALSCVPSGHCYLPEMSRIFKAAAPELGYNTVQKEAQKY